VDATTERRELAGLLLWSGVGVEKLLSRDFTSENRSQVIESSFAVGPEIHRNYSFGSFFNTHGRLRSLRIGRLGATGTMAIFRQLTIWQAGSGVCT
jgi:hypothetical protein